MANTLTEYGYLCNNEIKKGIIDTIISVSPLLRRLPFIELNSNALAYNLESAAAGGSWVTTGDTIVESTPTWAQRTIALSELIGDADVDTFAAQTRDSQQDLKAAIIEKKAKGLAADFDKAAIMGRTTSEATYLSTKCMKGLLIQTAECESLTSTVADLDGVVNTQVYAPFAESNVLTLEHMGVLIDRVLPAPDVLMMSRRMRRKLTTLAQAAGTNLVHDNDKLGFPVTRWGDYEILINDYIYDNYLDGSSSIVTIASYAPGTPVARASGTDNSVIFAMKLGEDGVCGLWNGGIITEDLGILETKDATRTRIKMYPAIVTFSTRAIAAMIDVLDTAL